MAPPMYPRRPPHLLLLERDQETLATMTELLVEEGFEVHPVATLPAALEALARGAYSAILADCEGELSSDPQARAHFLSLAAPLPVIGLSSAFPEGKEPTGFAMLLHRPFGLSELLERVGQSLNLTLDRGQAVLVGRYFAALAAQDWEGLGQLCTEGVEYSHPRTATAPPRLVAGRAALLAFARQTFNTFPDVRFEVVHLAPLPHGLFAHYRGRWSTSMGPAELNGAVAFSFEGEAISRIGVRLDVEALGRLTGMVSP